MRTAPWRHQQLEFVNHRYDAARAIFWQMRTGKSKAVIDNACALAEAMEINGVIVIAPNGVHRNWVERELPRHHWSTISRHSHVWCNSDPYNRSDAERFLQHYSSDLYWFVINQESLIIKRVQHAIARFIQTRKSVMLVVDESHHFAVPGAKRTAVCRGLGRLCTYRRILSGTPVENSPLQAFSQFEILEKGALGYTTYGDFKQEYATYYQAETKSGKRFPALKGYRNLDRLKESMSRFTSVVLRSDCEDLPPTQIDVRYVEWNKTLRDHWDDCKHKVSAFFQERNARNIADGGAALIKLQQIEGGFWKQDDRIEQLVSIEKNPKIEAIKDEIEQHDGQVVIWCIYRHEIEILKRVFGEDACVLYGGTPERQRTIEEFRRGDRQIAICQPQAVGEGQDLSTATKIIWASQTPDAILRAQANERATAVGKGSVQIVDLITPGGVDSYYKRLTEKKVVLADDVSREGMIEILRQLEGGR